MNHNENSQNQNGEQNQQSHPSQPNNQIPPQPSYAPTDNTKLFSILAYIPLLWLVGLLADRGNPKVMYHVNQGILFNIAAVILSIAVNVISIILTAVLPILVIITGLLGLAVLAIDLIWLIMGIINACNGVEKPLPVIGTIGTIVK